MSAHGPICTKKICRRFIVKADREMIRRLVREGLTARGLKARNDTLNEVNLALTKFDEVVRSHCEMRFGKLVWNNQGKFVSKAAEYAFDLFTRVRKPAQGVAARVVAKIVCLKFRIEHREDDLCNLLAKYIGGCTDETLMVELKAILSDSPGLLQPRKAEKHILSWLLFWRQDFGQ